MTPRIRRAGVWFAPLLFIGMQICCAPAHSEKSERGKGARDILVVTIDTLRADHVGAYGNRGAITPHLDALARRGVLFERAFTTAPLTLPAHVSLFSGLLPMHSGVRVNGTDRVSPEVPLLAEELREAGFATGAAIGSFVLRSETGLARGFETYDEGFAANTGRLEAEGATRPETASVSGPVELEAERPGSEVVERALAWVDGVGSSRFFLWVHLFDPHAPYAPPSPYSGRFAERPYAGEVAYADACLGRLLEGLRDRGRLEKTVVVAAGDHGESLGEHGEATHGVFLYDATLRVPLVLVPPGGLGDREVPQPGSGGAAPRRVTEPVSLVDVAPTLREAAGLPAVPSDGFSLYGKLPSDRIVLAESSYPAVLLGWSPLRAARSAGEKYVEAPRPEFYELRSDPAEVRSRFDPGGAAVRRLAREMARRRAEAPPRPARTAALPDSETARRLASLGYLTPRHPSADLDRIDSTRVDPKDRIRWWSDIERGIVAQQAGRSAEAAEILEKLVREYPEEDPVLLRELAVASRRSGRVDRAIAVYERVIARFAPVADDYFGLGVSWHAKGRDDRAARAHDEAVRLDPSHQDAWINLGQERLALGALAEAEEAFRRAAALDGRSVDALSGLAAVAYERRDFATASARLREALAIAPGHREALANLHEVERAVRRARSQG